DTGCLGLEPDLATVGLPLLDQVLDHFLLAVDRDPFAGQAAKVDAVLLAGKAQLDAVVHEALADHALAYAGRGEQICRPLFQDAGPDSALDVVAAAPFENDGGDALPVEEMGEHEPGRTRGDDADLGSRHPILQNV